MINVNCISSSRNNIQNRNVGLSSKSYAGDPVLAQCLFLKTLFSKASQSGSGNWTIPQIYPCLKHSILENTSLLSAPWRNAVNSRISCFSPYTQTLPSFTITLCFHIYMLQSNPTRLARLPLYKLWAKYSSYRSRWSAKAQSFAIAIGLICSLGFCKMLLKNEMTATVIAHLIKSF